MHLLWLTLWVWNKNSKKYFSLSFEIFMLLMMVIEDPVLIYYTMSVMLLMMVIKNPVLIYYTMTAMLHSTQKNSLWYLSIISFQPFWRVHCWKVLTQNIFLVTKSYRIQILDNFFQCWSSINCIYMVFGQAGNIALNSIMKGLKTQILINFQHKERDIIDGFWWLNS